MMTPIEDIEQFRALALTLPEVRFTASGIAHPRISLFAATHHAGDVAAVQGRVAELPFDAAFSAAVARADADLRLYELDLANPSVKLGAVAAARTAAYGMMAIEPGPDLLALAAIADDPVIPVADGDPLALLADGCGRDIVALFGAIMAARMAQLPVILDGANALAAATLLHRLNPASVSHCAVPLGSPVEAEARKLGLASLRCTETRPLFALADTIVHCRFLAIAS